MERKYKKKSNLVNSTGYTPGYASEYNSMNIIPSEYITMENTPYPVYGQPLDKYGNPIDNPTYMQPGMNYDYGSDAAYVAEVPAYKEGGQKSDWISGKIKMLMGEGRPQKQAVAIAYAMWNQKHEMGGTQLPKMQFGDIKLPDYTKSTNSIDFTKGFYKNKKDPFKPDPINLNLSTDLRGDQANTRFGNSLFSGSYNIPENIGYQTPTAEEMAQGVQNAKSKNDGGASARSGSGLTQFYNPYGDIGMEDALGFSGQQFAEGNIGMGIAGSALGALKGASAFMGGMGAQKRRDQIMKDYAENQRNDITGAKTEIAMGRRGGYFQDAGTYRDELPLNMALKNPQFAEQRRKLKNKTGQDEDMEPIMEVNPVFGRQNSRYEDPDQITGYSDPNEMTDEESASFMDMYNKDQANQNSTSARDVWEQKTGMPWSKAKELGYTDGSAKDNTKLLSELNDPRFKKENLRTKPVATTPSKATPRKAEKKGPPAKTAKDFTYQDFQEATKNLPSYQGKQGNIALPNEGNMVTRVGERLANPLQTIGEYAKYGELPAAGFSKYSKNAYDQVLGVANPIYWANALGNAADYANEGEYKKAAIEALDAVPGLLGKLKYTRYLPLPGVAAKVPGLAQTTSKGLQVVNKAGTAVGPARKAAQLRNYFVPELGAGAQNARLGQGALRLGEGAKRIGQGPVQTGQLRFGFRDGGYFQEGGMQPEMQEEQGGGDQMQAIAQEVAGMLQQGADPQEILQQLVEAGLPEEQAMQVIQMVMEQMQGGQQEATPQLGYGGEMMDYLKNGGNHGGLDRWFEEEWVDIKTGKPCGRQKGESRDGYPACRPSKRVSKDTPKTASELSSSEKDKFKRSKNSSERISYQHNRKEDGGLIEDDTMYMKDGGNVPTNPELWGRAKSAARAKYDVYPSAYANGFASKWYKQRGGGWRKKAEDGGCFECGEEYEDGGYMYAEGGTNNEGFKALPGYVQAKILANMEDGGMYDMEEYAEGGTIPDRYKNAGFTKVGAKKQSTRPGKKWMVLAKKGDQYKIVHGGDDSMKDFSQHGSKDRKENFWNRMGGRNSAKASDPFSPLYWHKRFGTWQEGGEIEGDEEEMMQSENPQQEQIEDQVAAALQQGADPQEILQQLVEMGMPEQEAIQMIQYIMQELQGEESEMEGPEEDQPMMKSGGEYLAAMKGRTIKNYTYNKNTGNYDVEFE